MQGMIEMALLPIEESTEKKSILRIMLTTTVVINCICSAQNKQTNTSATMRRRVGAIQIQGLGFAHIETESRGVILYTTRN
jgi:hypothetical protein